MLAVSKPPAMSTLPSSRTVAVWPARELAMVSFTMLPSASVVQTGENFSTWRKKTLATIWSAATLSEGTVNGADWP